VLCVALLLMNNSFLHAVGIPLVYNLRISETTRLPTHDESDKYPYRFLVIGTTEFRHKHEEGHTQRISGIEGSFIYMPRRYYVRIDFAVGHVFDKTVTTRFGRTQSDDVLVYGGYTHSFSKKFNATLSALCGVPTHQDLSLQGIQLGYAHIAYGGQVDCSYFYASDYNHQILGAFRYMHFLPRDVCTSAGEQARYKIGDLPHFLILNSSRWNKHVGEVGFQIRWSIFTRICPWDAELVRAELYTRPSLFGTYKYRATETTTLLLALSYAFDVEHHPTNNKSIITLDGVLKFNF